MKCPRHNKALVERNTKYGKRFSCPVGGCTVVCWDGSTSTPANFGTRQKRIWAHNAFDNLWKSGIFKRKAAYAKLAEYMELPITKVHIGHFDIEQCGKVIEFARHILEGR